MPDDTIFIIFAELRRFNKELSGCGNDLEKMLYVIKNGWRLQNQPSELQDEIFARLLDACDIPRFSEDKRIKYDKDMYDERRRNGELAAAREEGMEKGVVSVAVQMKKMGLPVETIVQATGLDADVINGL